MSTNDEIELSFTSTELVALAKIGVGDWVRLYTIVARAAKRSLVAEPYPVQDLRYQHYRAPAPITEQDMLKTLDRRGMAAPANPDETVMSATELESAIIGAFTVEGYLYENALAELVKRAGGPEPNPMFVKLARAVEDACDLCNCGGNTYLADALAHYGLNLDMLQREVGRDK
jgi:hypothetical protein